jgi:hypothetical protein
MDRCDQLAESFQGVVLALHRHEHRVGSSKRIHRQKPERRWAVEQNVVHFLSGLPKHSGEAPLTLLDRRQLELGTRKGDRGGNDTDAGDDRVDDVGAQVLEVDHRVVDRRLERCTVNPESTRGVALRIEIHDQDPFAGETQIGGEIHDCRGLADAAFLVRARDRLPHSVPRSDRIHEHSFYQSEPL